MKPNTLHLVLICAASALNVRGGDIFDAPQNSPSPEPPTIVDGQAFLAATRTGDIPRRLSAKNLDVAAGEQMGASIKLVLVEDYGLQPSRIRRGGGIEFTLANALRHLTLYEYAGDASTAEKERHKRQFQNQIDEVFGKEGDRYNPYYGDSRAAFIRFAEEYTAALQEHKAAEEKAQQMQRLADAERKQSQEEEERKRQEKLRVEKKEEAFLLAEDTADNTSDQVKAGGSVSADTTEQSEGTPGSRLDEKYSGLNEQAVWSITRWDKDGDNLLAWTENLMRESGLSTEDASELVLMQTGCLTLFSPESIAAEGGRTKMYKDWVARDLNLITNGVWTNSPRRRKYAPGNQRR